MMLATNLFPGVLCAQYEEFFMHAYTLIILPNDTKTQSRQTPTTFFLCLRGPIVVNVFLLRYNQKHTEIVSARKK